MTFDFDPVRQRRAEQIQAAGRTLSALAAQVDAVAALFDDSAEVCSCCATTRYRNWGQRQVKAQIEGASDRLRTLGETLRRRSQDDEFLGENPRVDDMTDFALRAILNGHETAAIAAAKRALGLDKEKAVQS